jgi:hypothetical protein
MIGCGTWGMVDLLHHQNSLEKCLKDLKLGDRLFADTRLLKASIRNEKYLVLLLLLYQIQRKHEHTLLRS